MKANQYIEKFAFCESQIDIPVKADLNMVVIIPCYKEPDLINTLVSLSKCSKTDKFTEVIIVINYSENETAELKKYNQNTFNIANEWITTNKGVTIDFHIIKAYDLPAKSAGVGLARKIGMDEAVRRLDKTSLQDGIIVCLDADCLVASNYLVEIEKYFNLNSTSPSCHIAFEHRTDELNLTEINQKAIAIYEIYLRWYKLNFQKTGHPYAHYTIGSCIAVRSSIYQKQGGMNKRKAGEDFYFLQKIFTLGNFRELNTTCVYPSARGSDRVPFGTGAFINKQLGSNVLNYQSFNPILFNELKNFILCLERIYNAKSLIETENYPTLYNYLESINIQVKLNEAIHHTSNFPTFCKRFYQFFNGLAVLQFFHFAQNQGIKNVNLIESANLYLEQLDIKDFKREQNLLNLLKTYRNLER